MAELAFVRFSGFATGFWKPAGKLIPPLKPGPLLGVEWIGWPLPTASDRGGIEGGVGVGGGYGQSFLNMKRICGGGENARGCGGGVGVSASTYSNSRYA